MSAPVETLSGRAAAGAPPPAPESSGRRALAWMAALAVTFSAVVGSNVFGLRDYFLEPATSDPVPPALGRVADGGAADRSVAAPTSLRSQPWWQEVKTIEGVGAMTAPAFTIADGAIHWRVKGTCQSGQIVVRSPSQASPVVDRPCGGELTGSGVGSGPISLQVTANGPWKLTVAQLIDTPLFEPLTPAMTAPGSKVIASGSLYNIDKTGIGKVTVYEQADGRYSVRLDDFYVTAAADLQLRFSTLAEPRTTEEYLSAKSEFIVVMDVTAGSLNYMVPSGGDPTVYKSVLVWRQPIKSAFAAASLGPIR